MSRFFSLLIGAYGLVLGSFANQRSLTLGTPMTARKNNAALENMIGLFMNMNVLHFSFEPNQLLSEYFRQVNSEAMDAQIKQIPLEILVKTLKLENDMSQNPIFQTLFNLANADDLHIDKQIFSYYEPQTDDVHSEFTALYDLEIVISSVNKNSDDDKLYIGGSAGFYAKSYDQKSIVNFVDSYKFVLEQLAQLKKPGNADSTMIKNIEMVSYEQKQMLKSLKGETFYEISSEQTLNNLFEEIAEKYQSETAVVFDERILTYQSLNEEANQLAHYLLTSVIEVCFSKKTKNLKGGGMTF